MNNIPELVFLFIVAFAGSFSNTAVGGGWFIVFPGLIYRGIQPVISNATTMLALWTGHVLKSNPVRDDRGVYPPNLKYLILSCASGGFLGAMLIIVMPHRIFEHIGPFLLLLSFLLFTCYERILNYVVSRISVEKKYKYSRWMLVTLFFLGIYGGYFGAGLGMIIFILYRSYGIEDNAILERLASILVTVNAAIALIVFMCSGLIYWPFAPVVITGSIFGTQLGILVGNKIDKAKLKKVMIGIGAIVTLYFLNLVINVLK